MESKWVIKNYQFFRNCLTLALVYCSFMCAADILQQYVYSTMNTIQFYQRGFSVLLFFYGKPVIIIVSFAYYFGLC